MGLNNAVGGRLHKHQTMAIRALERTTWPNKKFFVLYKTHPCSHPILAKKSIKSKVLGVNFGFTRSRFCLFLGITPAFCTISPFYFGWHPIILFAQFPAFSP